MPAPLTSLPPEENAELTLSVERAFREAAVLERLEAIWAVILAKCFLLQWAIEAFQIPIRGLVYVWLLTFAMATMASALYLRANRMSLRVVPWQSRVSSALLAGLLLGLGSLAYAHGARGWLPAGAAAGLACGLLGNWALVRGVLSGASEQYVGAVAWWVFGWQAAQDHDGRALLWVGLGFLGAQALPGFVRLARRRREQRV
ncbi:hypothetical protein LBMAG55_15280 [Verrucomicrobiota bacterium]|nr:hypothetical protein EMGBD4_00210 [Verrucomicrobiota bacterium]GDY18205.1 hypothetical protein LBMAG55_15280 [Verrucomicrobiota bacterium]